MLSDYNHQRCNAEVCREWWVATRTYVAGCTGGKFGTPITATREARSYVSQQDADKLAAAAAKEAAESQLVCYFKGRKSFTARCPNDATITNTVIAEHLSLISQDDADFVAFITAKSAAIAGLSCGGFENFLTEATAVCAPGTFGSDRSATIQPGTFFSFLSQEDANAQAQAAATAMAQRLLVCVPGGGQASYTNTEQSATAHCPAGMLGDPVTIRVDAGSFFSDVSQEDADARALAYAQAQAQSMLSCSRPIFVNAEQVFTAYCPEGQTGDPATVTVLAGTYASTISQDYVDALALGAAQRAAAAQLNCLYLSQPQSYTARCFASHPGTEGDDVYREAAEGAATGATQEAANIQAFTVIQEDAESALECWPLCRNREFNLTGSIRREDEDATFFTATLRFNPGSGSGNCSYNGVVIIDGEPDFSAVIQISRNGIWQLSFGTDADAVTRPDDGTNNPAGDYPDTFFDSLGITYHLEGMNIS